MHNPHTNGPMLTGLFVEFVLEQLALWQPELAAGMSAERDVVVSPQPTPYSQGYVYI